MNRFEKGIELGFCVLAVLGGMAVAYSVGQWTALENAETSTASLIDLVTLVVAALSVYFIYRTFRTSVEAVHEATIANRIAASAERPWIVLDRFDIAQDGPPGQVGIGIHFINCGRSVAPNVQFRARYSGNPNDDLTIPHIANPVTGAIGPGQTQMNATSPDVFIADLRRGTLRIRIRADYLWTGGELEERFFEATYQLSSLTSGGQLQLRWSVIGVATAT